MGHSVTNATEVKINVKKEAGDDGDTGTGAIDHVIFQNQRQEYESVECKHGSRNITDERGTIFPKKYMKLLFGHSKSHRLRVSHPKPLLTQNRRRLGRLLSELVRAHNWKEASGVLSVLLRGSPRGTSFSEERRNFLATMEIHKHYGEDKIFRINQMYDVWLAKLAWLKKSPRQKYSCYLGLALFYLSCGSIDEALSAIKLLIKDDAIPTDPIVNLMYGLILYQRWYSSLPNELQIKGDQVHMFTDAYRTASKEGQEMFESSDEHNAINDEVFNYSSTFASESSVGNAKNFLGNSKNLLKRESNSFNLKQELSISASEASEAKPSSLPRQSKYSIFFAHGLEKNLLPIQLNQLSGNLEHDIYSYRSLANGNYGDAVKHLKIALHSVPPLLAALMPLIQILLLGDNVEEALMELEYACNSFDSQLPFRLKARILECFHNTQVEAIYEDALKKDPTCNYSLQRLIEMHTTGNYNTILLFEVLTSHLDATDGTSVVWEEFASCFLEFASSGTCDYEDCISANVQGASSSTIHPSRVHKVFTEGNVKESWKVRFRWWKTRHFGKNSFLREMQLGDYKLLASKAACAYHMYGEEIEYIKAAISSLEKEEKEEEITFLERHMDNGMSLLILLETVHSNALLLPVGEGQGAEPCRIK